MIIKYDINIFPLLIKYFIKKLALCKKINIFASEYNK